MITLIARCSECGLTYEDVDQAINHGCVYCRAMEAHLPKAPKRRAKKQQPQDVDLDPFELNIEGEAA